MKKLFYFALVLAVLLSCLTACHFAKNVSGVLAGDPEATPKVEEMMLALAESRLSDAKALMHPQAVKASDNAIAQMGDYLEGRKVSAMERISVTVNTSTGTSGNARQERLNYRVTLTDGTVIYLNVVYLSNNQGSGFAVFQVVLGVV